MVRTYYGVLIYATSSQLVLLGLAPLSVLRLVNFPLDLRPRARTHICILQAYMRL